MSDKTNYFGSYLLGGVFYYLALVSVKISLKKVGESQRV